MLRIRTYLKCYKNLMEIPGSCDKATGIANERCDKYWAAIYLSGIVEVNSTQGPVQVGGLKTGLVLVGGLHFPALPSSLSERSC